MARLNGLKALECVKFLFVFLFFVHFGMFSSKASNILKKFTIMLDPAGDAQHAGRQIGDCLERGVSLQFVEDLKDELQRNLGTVDVAITRFAGETVQPLQNANFSNRFGADLHMSFHFYQEKAVVPKIYLFLFSYGDDFITKKHDLHFYPYDEAHLINIDTTKMYARKIKDFLQKNDYRKKFDFQGIAKIPFKPLIGVKAPAVALAVGLRKKKDWKKYIDVFVNVIRTIVEGEKLS